MSKPAKNLDSTKVEKSLQRNVLPAIHDKASVLSCRALLPEETVKSSIEEKRENLDGVITSIPGVEFVISCLTGTTTNCRNIKTVRPGIAYLVSFKRNVIACESGVFKAIHDSGMDATVSMIKTIKASKDPILQGLKQVVKDHNSTYAKDLVSTGNSYCKTPCLFIAVDNGLTVPLQNAVANLSAEGMNISFKSKTLLVLPEVDVEPGTGIGKALRIVEIAMKKVGHCLYRGEVYKRAEKGQYAYVPFNTVDKYLQWLVRNPALQDDLILQLSTLSRLLSDPNCKLVDQLEFDYDLIEVLNGKCLKLSSRTFVNTPLKKEDLGKISPRSFADYVINAKEDGGFFESSIVNSFPDLKRRIEFLNKFYQCFLFGQLPFKTKKLVVCGECDSGKTSWAKVFYGLLRPSKIASITKEKTFGLCLLEDDTELILLDEWSKVTTSVDYVKKLLQGGDIDKPVKNQTAVKITNNATFYITCNNEPDFEDEQVNVERRIEVFKTKALIKQDINAPKWIKDNAMRCLVWIIRQLNRHKDLIPLEERFYEKAWDEPADIDALKDDNASEMQKVMSLTATDIREISISNTSVINTVECDSDSGSSSSSNSSSSSSSSDNDLDCLNIDVEANAESDIDPYDVTIKPKYVLRTSDINTPTYMKEVRRIINNKMDAPYGKLSGLNYLSFMNRFSKRRPAVECSIPDPKLDAWLCISGQKRPLFDTNLFINTYPSIKEKIKETRVICQINRTRSTSWHAPKEHRLIPDSPETRNVNVVKIESLQSLLPVTNEDVVDFNCEQYRNKEEVNTNMNFESVEDIGETNEPQIRVPKRKKRRDRISSDEEDTNISNKRLRFNVESLVETTLAAIVDKVAEIEEEQNRTEELVVDTLSQLVQKVQEIEQKLELENTKAVELEVEQVIHSMINGIV